MKLTHFGYSTGDWDLDLIDLRSQNLFVGKNAVGKSKTLMALSDVASIIAQTKSIDDSKACGAFLAFEAENSTIAYSFVYSGRVVAKEKLDILDKATKKSSLCLERDKEVAHVDGKEINPPGNKLVLHVQRDVVKYPVFEKIISWAENVGFFSFNELDFYGDSIVDAWQAGQSQSLYTIISSIDEDAKTPLIDNISKVGYILDNIEAVEFGGIKKVTFSEKGIKKPLFDFELSKGMFRTVYVLAYIEYLSHSNKPSLLLIDDLCEGLDYDRSTKLGKIVFDFCEQNDVQLIAASNDSFLMDVVDLKYWNILTRNGKDVKAINQNNNPELFKDFKFTGLSNFDLFSSDFIERHTNLEVKDE